jgi:hypothetical protein
MIMQSERQWQLTEMYTAVPAAPTHRLAQHLAHHVTVLELEPYSFTTIEVSKEIYSSHTLYVFSTTYLLFSYIIISNQLIFLSEFC